MKTVLLFLSLIALVACSAVSAHSQSWFTATIPFHPGHVYTPLLLTDGTVLFQAPDGQTGTWIDWWRLTPDSYGSYSSSGATWQQLASFPSNYCPSWFATAVLPDGRVIAEGGEGNVCGGIYSTLGFLYDPAANTWTSISPPSWFPRIGDAMSAVLANGTFMLGSCCSSASPPDALFDEATLSWTSTGTLKADDPNEEGWVLLPNNKVLTIDTHYAGSNGHNSEVYTPSTGSWTSAGDTVVQLWGSGTGENHEIGPATLRPDGTVFATGASTSPMGSYLPAHTAIYNTITSTWGQGPDFPIVGGNVLSAADYGAELLPNGKVLVVAHVAGGESPGYWFEWDGTTLTQVLGPRDNQNIGETLLLPTGQVLHTDGNASVLEFYTSSGTYNPAWAPTISSVSGTLTHGNSYTIYGTKFNGFSQAYGSSDDFENATNYPLVRITNNSTSHVFYCKTHGHSTMAVAYSGPAFTQFDVPATIETGASSIVVVANGIPSSPVSVTVN